MRKTLNCQSLKKQNGVALIIAMLISAIVVALSVKASWQFELAMSRSANAWLAVQQETSLTALEDAARFFLDEDFKNEQSLSDNVQELNGINSLLQFEPTEGIFLSGLIEDAHSRFNLNHLQQKVQNVQPGSPAADSFTEEQKKFIRLLQTIPIEEETFLQEHEAIAITESIIDWLDADTNATGFGGAEEDYYSSLEPPIVIANRKMLSVSELLVIKGMTPLLYRALLPYVVVLQEDIAMNVNTIPAALVRTFNEKDNLQPQPILAIEDFLLDRGEAGFEELQDFLDVPSLQALVGSDADGNVNFDSSKLGVKSNYFLLFGQVEISDHIGRNRVLLKRGEDGTKILRRTDANF